MTIPDQTDRDRGGVTGQPDATVELQISGMTCASCAARIEQKLNRMPGVSATVNYATETAQVALPAGTAVTEAIATVEATGYTACLSESPQLMPAPTSGAEAGAGEDGEVVSLRRRLVVCAVLTAPVVVLAMIPPLQFPNWQWLSLTLAAPVVVWGAWPFRRAAAVNARHGAATMDTLISVGVLAAFGWSLYALLFGQADMPGMRMSFALFPGTRAGAHEIYLEVAAAVTVFLLAGRFFEARAKKRSGAALRALLELGASSAFRSTSSLPGTCSWSGRGKRSPPMGRWSRGRLRWMSACSPVSMSRSRSVPVTP
jgi:Cu+-exporting ATPase